jgi:hypothetical protein
LLNFLFNLCTAFKLELEISGMLKKIVVLFFVGFLAWAYKAIQPPPPKICGSPNGPPVTAARIKLSDGRHLAYIEHGVPKEMAKYKIVFVHGFDSFRHDAVVPKALSPVLICWFVLCYFYLFGTIFQVLKYVIF